MATNTAGGIAGVTPQGVRTYLDILKTLQAQGTVGATDWDKVRAQKGELAKYLGTTDYDAQLLESRKLTKLQMALALAQRGFASMGAQPQRGESPIGTLGRTLLSPLAADISPIAGRLMQQRQAAKAAQAQEERQLKLAAFQQAQAENIRIGELAFKLMPTATKGDKAPFEAIKYIVQRTPGVDGGPDTLKFTGPGGVPIQVRQERGKEGSLGSPLDLVSGNPVTLTQGQELVPFANLPDNLKGVAQSTDSTKPITSWLTNVQVKPVKGKDDEFRDAPGALRIADATGKNSRVVLNNATLDFNKNSPTYNARLVEKGSDQSAFYSPTSKSVFLSKPALELFGIDSNLLNQKATYREYLVKPDRASPNSRSIKELVVAGRSFFFNQHPGYSPETGDITVQRGEDEAPVTYLATQLFREEDPKAFTSAGTMTVPSDPGKLASIKAIPGLSGVTEGDVVEVERNQQGQMQIRRGNVVVGLTGDQSALFQTRDLSPVQKVEARQVLEPRTSYVNTSNRTLTVGGQTIAPNQIGAFSKTDINSAAFLNVSDSFREVRPVSTDPVTYMVKEPKTITISGRDVEYVPGDEISFTPQEFGNLSEDVRKVLTDDPALRATTLKKNYFTALWKIISEQEPRLTVRTPKPEELDALLGMFPAGMRSGSKTLRDEIFNMIHYGVDPEAKVPPEVKNAEKRALTYTELVGRQLAAARNRYEDYIRRKALPDVPWDTLSFESQIAFAEVKSAVQLHNVEAFWDKARARLAADKATYTNLAPDDVAAYAAASEILILAKHLRDNQGLDATGRYFGWFGGLQANLFADLTPITSGGTQRLQSVINAMKSRYATLAGQEGEGRPSDFRVGLQQNLIPVFNKAESLNKRNLNLIIERLEATLKSAFTPEILSSTVIPRSFEDMAAAAGVSGKTDQRRYRWVDPSVSGPVPVTRESVLTGVLGLFPPVFEDIRGLKAGRRLPRSLEGTTYIKIRNLDDGTVVVQEARKDGRPNPEAPEVILTQENFK